jgi:hypothetical protein
MKNRLGAIVLATAVMGVAGLGIPQTPAADAPATKPADGATTEIPVRQVVLFSSGVGYFEHYGTINGDGSAELRFKTTQINDILKSLLLQDLDGGKVTAVTYASQDPIDKTLKSFQVDITANPPLADLLNQLRGAKVTLTSNGDKTVGVILGVEHKKVVVGDKSKGDTIDEAVLNLVSGGKIVSQPLDVVNSIELDDPKLQDELNKALVALAGARDQDKKPVKISFTGKGERHVRLGYVVETPIWKTSYRLILSDKKPAAVEVPVAPTSQPAADGTLQGWAIIENQTDNDWNNVELSLVSGRPISFVENLYQPLYIPRPVVEPELFASLRPQTYEAGMEPTTPPAPVMAPMAMPTAAPSGGRSPGGGFLSTKSRRSSPYDGQDSILLPNANGGGGGDEAGPIDATKSISSVASATSIGELFEYTVGNVTLPRQRSAMIPIITDPIEVERVSIFNARVLPRNPLNGARVKNTTKKHLLAGPVTVLDGATYAGDAQIDNIPPGQERLLSYGVDLQMLVDAKDNQSDDQLMTGKIVKGILVLTHKNLRGQTYVAENKSDHDKTLLIEHPRYGGGWELVDTVAPLEKTDAVYRFKEVVPANKSARLVVSEQVTTDQTLAILPTDTSSLEFYRQSGKIPKPVQDALAKAIELKNAVTETDRQIAEARQTLNDIDAEQGRIRNNLNTITKSGAYYTRLMTKLDDEETQIEKTRSSIDELTKKRDSQRKDLDGYLENLNVG